MQKKIEEKKKEIDIDDIWCILVTLRHLIINKRNKLLHNKIA